MNGNTHEITWKQGSMEHACWASDEEDSRFVCEALKLHPSVESVRVVALVMKWDRPEKVMRTSSPVGTAAIMPSGSPIPEGWEVIPSSGKPRRGGRDGGDGGDGESSW